MEAPHTVTNSWWRKYKLYHLPFWFAYHCMWWTLMTGSVYAVANNILFSAYSIKFLFYVVFQALGVYFNLYFLMPRFLDKGKYALYLTYVILTIFTCAVFITAGYYASALLSGHSFKALYGIDPSRYSYFFQVNALPSTTASMTLGMSVKLTKKWIASKRREQLLQQEKLETELKFLRNQFNPHFLFNTINSIFFLIHKNPDMASESLSKFSELLRYQLYECNDARIPLEKEITYLRNFIELETLRQNDNVEITLDIDHKHCSSLAIAPFMLITFVENAFKHVSRHEDRPNLIAITLRLDKEELIFTVLNSKSILTPTDIISYGGIGLENVKRRLNLVYPEDYALDIYDEADYFETRLRVKLAEQIPGASLQKTA